MHAKEQCKQLAVTSMNPALFLLIHCVLPERSFSADPCTVHVIIKTAARLGQKQSLEVMYHSLEYVHCPRQS